MTPNNFLKTLSIIHISLLIGLLIVTVFVFWYSPDIVSDMNSNDIFIYVVPLVAVAGYFCGKYIFQNRIQNIEPSDGLQHKLGRYQTASIINYVLIEGTAVLALLGYYLSGNALHLVVALCLIVYLFSQRPTKKRIIAGLKLSQKEQNQLNSQS